jgi:hypothetical protein
VDRKVHLADYSIKTGGRTYFGKTRKGLPRDSPGETVPIFRDVKTSFRSHHISHLESDLDPSEYHKRKSLENQPDPLGPIQLKLSATI